MPTYLLLTRPEAEDPLVLHERIAAMCPALVWLQPPTETSNGEYVALFEASPEEAQHAADTLIDLDLDSSEVWPAPRWPSTREMIDDLEQRAETD